jgi:hypothetical protein
MNRTLQLLIGGVLAAVTAVSGSVPSAWADEPEADAGDAIFYPMPPDRPRLQFLASYSNELDVSSKGRGGFRDFVFGGRDKEGSFINKPYGVAIHAGAIYVVDARGGGWGAFDIANGRAYFVRPSGGGKLRKPINMTIDADGTKYVTDTDRQQIIVFGPNDRYVTAFGDQGQFKPIDVAIRDERRASFSIRPISLLRPMELFWSWIRRISACSAFLQMVNSSMSLAVRALHPGDLPVPRELQLIGTVTST